MRNIWIGNYRRQAGGPQTVPLDEIGETLLRFDGGDPPSATDVESSVVDELSVASIRMAIDRLPSQIRQVVVLADVEDTPYGVIAHALAIPIGTVASRLFRGRRLLRRALKDQARGAGDLAKAG
jgi:RNA polymerase sigma-70 factor, ECF subfamily